MNNLFQSMRKSSRSGPGATRRQGRPKKLSRSLMLECLEDRCLLSTILWANEFDPNNGFSAFGSNAANARLDVETAISAWENVIQNFNQPGGGNSLTVTVSISGQGRGGNTNTTALNAGYPTSAAISLAGGDDGNGAGYFFDPTPSDNSEFEGTLVNDFSGLAQSGSPASNLTDFYTIITHELGHAVGFTGFKSLYQSSSYIHETNVPNPPAFFWVFQGPSVTHLMTSNNGGTSDYGVPIHSAWTDGNVPWQGQQLHGVEDLMNAGSGPSERRLIPSYLALILHDVYNYDVTAPQYMDTMFAMLDSQGNLLLRGGVGSSNDVITISQDPVFASFFVVSISIGSPVAGISPNPVYTQEYYAPAVKAITIEAGAGSNVINLQSAPVPVNIEGSGTDTVNIGSAAPSLGGTLANIAAPVNVSSTSGSTTLNVDDSGDTTAGTAHMGTISGSPGLGYIDGLAHALITYEYAYTASLTINTGTASGNVFGVWENGVPTTLIGNGLTTVNVGDGLVGVQSILGTLNIENPSSFTTINVDDSANTGINTAHMGTIPSGPPSWGYITGLAPADIHYKYADATSLTINTSSADGDVFGVWENGVPTTLIGNGLTTVNVGDGLVGVQSILGTLNIENPSSFTTINVDDSANTGINTAHMGTIPSGPPSWGYITSLAPADIHYKYADATSLTINTSSADGDVFGVWENGVPTTLIGNGLTTVNVGDGLVGVQSILGTLNIENPSSFTTINVDDSANTGINTAHMGTIPSGPPSWGYITGLAPADIHYKYADATSLTINTSSADGDVFSVWENGVPTTP